MASSRSVEVAVLLDHTLSEPRHSQESDQRKFSGLRAVIAVGIEQADRGEYGDHRKVSPEFLSGHPLKHTKLYAILAR